MHFLRFLLYGAVAGTFPMPIVSQFPAEFKHCGNFFLYLQYFGEIPEYFLRNPIKNPREMRQISP